ncbi:MAG: sulfur oxidation c-type cytochrome SoxA [Pseudomonadota bacterium]|nr:sulfur oxidation c-type cytochrome SoxA [Pseudomonadota bacterium]
MKRIVLSMLMGASSLAVAQSASESIAKYREMLAEGNPAELWEARGEALWNEKRGPKQVSLAGCDLGKGAGVVKGAYVGLPRYFADTGKVQDVEQRLITCMTTLQGYTVAQASVQPFGAGASKRSTMEALVSWIASESRGMPIAPGSGHPLERQAYQAGKAIFNYRGGPYDFACATCHSAPDKRIRLQDLPDLTSSADARKAYASWPAYRVSQGEVRTMQHRLADCFRQQRFPEPAYASDVLTALTMYLAEQAKGGEFNAPALKR